MRNGLRTLQVVRRVGNLLPTRVSRFSGRFHCRSPTAESITYSYPRLLHLKLLLNASHTGGWDIWSVERFWGSYCDGLLGV